MTENVLSQKALQKILGMEEDVILEPEEMAKRVVVTFYPSGNHKVSENILRFADKLKQTLEDLGVKIISYEESLTKPSLKRRLKIFFYSLIGKLPKGYKTGKKIREGVSVVSLGEGLTGDLAMDNTMSFAKNSVITILDMPDGINSETEFHKHFDLAMNLFTYHMTNIAIVVGDKTWIPYNFNASHPSYSLDGDFKKDILRGLIPKIYAPIKPPKLREFKILREKFDPFDKEHKELVADFLESGTLLEKTNLYPPGKRLDDLPFRNEFYKWIGQIHLDHRNGMSFGFLARQMPVKPGQVFELTPDSQADFFNQDGSLYVIFNIADRKVAVEVPEVWVITQRSGSKKTDIDPNLDLVKIGLKNGQMLMQVPKGLKMTEDYKPSFDTKVILAHAVGNALIAAVIKYLKLNSQFVDNLEENGLAIAHWHGYINPGAIPRGWAVYGESNLPVSCSTFQSGIYALDGKINSFFKFLQDQKEYLGDIHVEPHHGSNITHFSLRSLADFLSQRDDITKLGNYYYNFYEPKNP